MRTLDLTPLYRSTVGFDRMANLIDATLNAETSSAGYPPYNIEKTGEDAYRITIAAAGFTEDDLRVEVREGTLLVGAEKQQGQRDESVTVLHRGIAERSFERRFHLADHVRVDSATLENGLLHIALVREVPEALKPRQIAITSANANGSRTIESNAA